MFLGNDSDSQSTSLCHDPIWSRYDSSLGCRADCLCWLIPRRKSRFIGTPRPTLAVPLAGYRVYRNGVLVGSTTSTTYTDTGLAAATQYCYSIMAYDYAGNSSSGSALSLRHDAGSAGGRQCSERPGGDCN